MLRIPCLKTLVRELKWLRKSLNHEYKFTHQKTKFGWPYDSCINFCKSFQDLDFIMDLSESGEMGDLEDWLMAEERWSIKGVNHEDILIMESNWPFRKIIKENGFPLAASSLIISYYSQRIKSTMLKDFIQLNNLTKHGNVKKWICDAIIRNLDSNRLINPLYLEPQLIQSIIEESNRNFISFEIFRNIQLPDKLNKDWICLIKLICEKGHILTRGDSNNLMKFYENLLILYNEKKQKNVLKILCSLNLHGMQNKLSMEILLPLLNSNNHEERYIASAIILSNGFWNEENTKQIIDALVLYNENKTLPLRRLLFLLQKRLSNNSMESLILQLHYRFLSEGPRFITDALFDAVARRRSDLSLQKKWDDLELPQIYSYNQEN